MFANRGDVGKAKVDISDDDGERSATRRVFVYGIDARGIERFIPFASSSPKRRRKKREKQMKLSVEWKKLWKEKKKEEEEEEHITRKTFIEDDIYKKEDEDELEDRLDATFARVEALRERMLDAGIVPDAASFVTELVLAGEILCFDDGPRRQYFTFSPRSSSTRIEYLTSNAKLARKNGRRRV